MGMTAERLSAEMSLDEFHDHWADYLADPWGEQRADLRSGIVASLIYNAHRGPSQGAKSAQDFMPYRNPPEDEAAVRKKLMKRHQKRRN